MSVLNIRPEILGVRLKAARVSLKLTQEQVAESLGLSRTTLVAIEAGKRQISSNELRTFAEFYKVSEGDLLSGRDSALTIEVKFRSNAPATDESAQSITAALLSRLAASTIEMEEMLPASTHIHSSYELPAVTISRLDNMEQQAEDAALSLRQRLGLGFGPIQDLMSLMETDLGLRVFERPLDSTVSGAVAFDEKFGGFVLLNLNHPFERRRLTASHEICHVLIRKSGLSVLFAADKMDDREDKFCDLFSRSFLMPAMTVRKKAAELRAISAKFLVRHILMMAIYFNVSIEAMARRLETLGLVAKGKFESLKERGLGLIHLNEVRNEMKEPRQTANFTPRIYFLAATLYENSLLSEQQIARKLDLDLLAVRGVLSGLSSISADLLDAES